MALDSSLKSGLLTLLLLALSACGGGGSDSVGGGNTTNRAPVANAGTDQVVDERATVTLNGSGTDPDSGTTLTYSWSRRSGPTVDLSNETSATPNFTAPDVTALDTPQVLIFQLTVSDGSLRDTDDVSITVNDIGVGANSPPIANAGRDQNVQELSTVNLDGSGSSDADGDALIYSWVQIGTPAVALADADTDMPSFTSPDVAPGSTVTLQFELTVDDGGDTASDTVDVTVAEARAAVTISGKLFYEQPQPNHACRGYDFDNIVNKPIRRAPVELRSAGNVVIATTETDDDGAYAFTNVDSNVDVSIRIIARSIKSGVPSWNVEVRDNTDLTKLPLEQRPLYVKEWSFNTGPNGKADWDLVAATGWGLNPSGGYSYVGSRDAAPFSILDALVDGVIFVTTADPNVDMGSLDAYWSINNTWTAERSYDTGETGNTHYTSNPDGGQRNPSIFLLGDAEGRLPDTVAIDTDEFDRGVIQHEWGHFFEDELSRSDSIGGRHTIPGTVEPRVAFGEGWGYGIAAIIGGDPYLCDTGSPDSSGFGLDIETWRSYGMRGFFNEMSVATLLYDLYDPANEGATDNGELGFAPIYDTMVGPQVNTDAFTTIFSFATELKNVLTDQADRDFVDALLRRENVDTGLLDEWASGQTTAPVGADDFVPVYLDLPTDGSVLPVCVNNEYDPDGDGNKPGEWRYFRFITTGAPRSWTLTAQADPVPPPTNDRTGRDRSDPDFYLYRNGNWLSWPDFGETNSGTSGDADFENLVTIDLSADTYTVAFQDWRYEDPEITSDYPERVCFNITANPN